MHMYKSDSRSWRTYNVCALHKYYWNKISKYILGAPNEESPPSSLVHVSLNSDTKYTCVKLVHIAKNVFLSEIAVWNVFVFKIKSKNKNSHNVNKPVLITTCHWVINLHMWIFKRYIHYASEDIMKILVVRQCPYNNLSKPKLVLLG